MDFFNADKIKSMAQNAQAKVQQAAGQAAQLSQQAALAAKTAAEKAAVEAQQAGKGIKQAANQAASQIGNRSSMVGQTVTVSGRPLYVDTLLAEGGFGSVYTAIPVDTDPTKRTAAPEAKVVLKRMFAGSSELAKQLINEVKLMKQIVHPNVVKVIGAESRQLGREGVEILVVMELCPGGHLLSRLNTLKETRKVLPWTKVLDVFLQITRPVAAMHALSPPTAHRDLKFENVLIAGDGSLRLCDFGSASSHSGVIADKADRAEQEDAILRYTTPHFRAPEMVDLYGGQPLDVRTDVWALGCMLYGLAYLSHPFQDSGNLAIMAARYKLPTSPAYPAPVHTLIRACLQYRPDDRPTAAQIVQYCEACVAVGNEAGPFPALQLSGGASVPSAAVPAPPPGADYGLPDGSVMITGNGDGNGSGAGASAGTGGAAAAANRGYHAPTAQDILQQVQAQSMASAVAASTGGAKSSALAARLAKKGGAPGPIGAPAPAMAAPQQAYAAPAPAPVQPASSGLDGFAFDSGPSTSPVQQEHSHHHAQAHAPVPAPASASSGGFDDFDVFGSGGGTASGPAGLDDGFGFDAPASASGPASAVRPASGGSEPAFGLGGTAARPPSAGAQMSASFGSTQGSGRGQAPVAQARPQAAHAQANVDLDDFFGSSGPAAKAAAADDLLGFAGPSSAASLSSSMGARPGQGVGMASAHSHAPSAAAVPASSVLEDPFAAFSLGGAGAAPRAAAQPVQPKPAPLDDPFAF